MPERDNHDPRLLDQALDYAARGWRVVPLHNLLDGPGENGKAKCSCGRAECNGSAGKHPRQKAWQNEASANEADIRAWWRQWPQANVGVVLGQASGIVDFECDSPAEEAVLTKLFAGDVPPTLCFRSSRGVHHLFKWRDGLPRAATYKIGCLTLRIGNGGKGSQSVFPPSLHPSGKRYTWTCDLGRTPLAELRDEIVARIWNWDGIEHAEADIRPDDRERALEALRFVPPAFAADRQRWLGVGMALHSVDASPAMLAAWDDWSRHCPEKWKPGCCEMPWKYFKARGPITLGSLIYWAKQGGWNVGPSCREGLLCAPREERSTFDNGRKRSNGISARAGEPAGNRHEETVISVNEGGHNSPSRQEGPTLLAFARREGRRSPNLDDPQEQADLYVKLEMWAAKNGGAAETVLRKLHQQVIAELRRERSGVTENREWGYTEHGLQFEQGCWQPGEWKLTVIKSDPVTYRLFVPRWVAKTYNRTGQIVLDVDEYRSADRVAARVQAETGTVVLDETPGVWESVWNGSRASRRDGLPPRKGLRAALLQCADDEEPPPLAKRYVMVAEYFKGRLDRAQPVQENGEPHPSRPTLMQDGSIAFAWRRFWSEPIRAREVAEKDVRDLATRLRVCAGDFRILRIGFSRLRMCVLQVEHLKRLAEILQEEEGSMAAVGGEEEARKPRANSTGRARNCSAKTSLRVRAARKSLRHKVLRAQTREKDEFAPCARRSQKEDATWRTAQFQHAG